MVYTFSYQPTVDIEVKADSIVIGKKNMADSICINYSKDQRYMHNILSCLGASSKALGFVNSGLRCGFESQFCGPCCNSEFIYGPDIDTHVGISLEGSFNTFLSSPFTRMSSVYYHQLQKQIGSLEHDDSIILLEPQSILNLDSMLDTLKTTDAFVCAIFDENCCEMLDDDGFSLAVIKQGALKALSGCSCCTVDEAISTANGIRQENVIIPLDTGVIFRKRNSDCIYLEYFPSSTMYRNRIEHALISGFAAAKQTGLPFRRSAIISFACACASLNSKTQISKQEIFKYIRLCDRTIHSI